MSEKEVRLIDANACSSKLNELGYNFGESGDYVFGGGLLHAANIVEEQPTVDPESLRPHGKWIMRGGRRYCSHCGERACVTRDMEDFWYTVGTNFCPNCGARMED